MAMQKERHENAASGRPVLVLLPYASLSGLEMFGIRFMEDLRRRGIRSVLACPAGSLLEKTARERGLETRPLNFGYRWNPVRQLQMHRLLAELSPLVSIGFRTHVLTPYHLARLLTGQRAPIHLFYRLGAGNIKRIDPFHRVLFRLTASVIANAGHVQRKIRQYWAIDPGKVFCIPSGIDTKKYKPDAPRRAALRARLGLGPDDLLIGNTGRIEAEKGSEDLVEAVFARVPEPLRPRVHLVFVGREGSPGFIDRLKAMAAAAAPGGAQRLHFLPFTPAIEEVYPGFDQFVLPVRSHETYAYVVLEALASGVPVLAPAAGGMTEMFTHGREGRFYRHRDLASLSEELNGLLALSPEERGAMAAAARAHVLRTADWDRMMEEYFRVLGLPAGGAMIRG